MMGISLFICWNIGTAVGAFGAGLIGDPATLRHRRRVPGRAARDARAAAAARRGTRRGGGGRRDRAGATPFLPAGGPLLLASVGAIAGLLVVNQRAAGMTWTWMFVLAFGTYAMRASAPLFLGSRHLPLLAERIVNLVAVVADRARWSRPRRSRTASRCTWTPASSAWEWGRSPSGARVVPGGRRACGRGGRAAASRGVAADVLAGVQGRDRARLVEPCVVVARDRRVDRRCRAACAARSSAPARAHRSGTSRRARGARFQRRRADGGRSTSLGAAARGRSRSDPRVGRHRPCAGRRSRSRAAPRAA